MALAALHEFENDNLDSALAVAREALALQEYNLVTTILIERISCDLPNEGLDLIAQALAHQYPVKRTTIQFFEALPPRIRQQPLIQESEGYIHYNRVAPSLAVNCFSSVFETRLSTRNLLNLLRAFQLAEDDESITRLLDDPKFERLNGVPLERMLLATYLLEYSFENRAVQLAYAVVAANLSNGSVVEHYLNFIVNLKTRARREQEDAVNVQFGQWIRFKSGANKTYDILLGETTDRPWGQSVEPENEFVQLAIGLSIGDTVTFTNALGIVEEWTIDNIAPWWERAFYFLSEQFGQRFPDNAGFASIQIAEGDLNPLLHLVRQYSDNLLRAEELYVSSHAPLAIANHGRSGGSVSFAHYLLARGRDIRVSFGTQAEIGAALTLIMEHRKRGAVIDALTAFTAAELGVLAVLENVLGPPAITGNEMTLLRAILAMELPHYESDIVTLTYNRNKYFRHISSPEDQQRRTERLEQLLVDITSTCTVEPADLPAVVPPLAETIMAIKGGDVLASALIAQATGRLYLCDDLYMRQWAADISGVKSLWLQIALESAFGAGQLSMNSYCSALVTLAALRRKTIPLSVPILAEVFSSDSTPTLDNFETLTNCLAGEHADISSHTNVAADFLEAIWTQGDHDPAKIVKASELVFSALLPRDQASWTQWAAPFFSRLSTPAGQCFANWCKRNAISGKPN